MSPFLCERLHLRHDRESFSCGIHELDDYLNRRASQDIRKNATAVYVLVNVEQPAIVLGYYTLSCASILFTELPEFQAKKLPKYPTVPAILIGRLARSLESEGSGRHLLVDALRRSVSVTKEIGAALIIVEAKNNQARGFYEHFGFKGLPGLRHKLFLSMKTAVSLFESK